MCHRRIASELEMGLFPTVMPQIQATRDTVTSTAVTSVAGSHTAQRSQSGVQQGASTSPHQPSVTPRTRAPLLNASPMQLPGETSFHKRLLQLKKTRNSPKPLPALFRSQNHLSDLPTCLKTKHCYKRTDKTPF